MVSTDEDRLVELAGGLSTADLVDAMGRQHRHRCHLTDLVSPTPGRILFGPAVTIAYLPSCAQRLPQERYNFGNLFDEAIRGGGGARVLVLGSNGHPDQSLGGGTKLSRLVRHKLAGVLADGRLRDFAELAGYGFTAYCRGEAVRWGGDVVTPYEANSPVVLSSVLVWPGDYVFADASGAVVIPRPDVHAVLEEARRIVADDVATTRALLSGRRPTTAVEQ